MGLLDCPLQGTIEELRGWLIKAGTELESDAKAAGLSDADYKQTVQVCEAANKPLTDEIGPWPIVVLLKTAQRLDEDGDSFFDVSSAFLSLPQYVREMIDYDLEKRAYRLNEKSRIEPAASKVKAELASRGLSVSLN